MDDQRHPNLLAVDQLSDPAQPLKVNLGILGLIDAVRRPNRRRKQVNAGPFDELNRLVWVAELSLIFHDLDLILDARDCAQLRLDRDVADLVAIVCHFFGLLDSGTFPQSAMLSAEAAKYLIRSE